MSVDNEDVVVPVVEIGEDSDDDVYIKGENEGSDVVGSDTESEGPEKMKLVKHTVDLSDEEALEHGEEDDDQQSHQDKKRKKKTKKAYGIDMTPPDECLVECRKHSKVLASKGNSKAAVDELVRAIAYARIVYGDGHWQLALSYLQLAEGYLDLLNYVPQAVAHARTAKQIMDAHVQAVKSDSDKSKVLELRMNINYILGRAFAAQKKFEESEKCFIKSENLYKVWSKSSISGQHDLDMEVKITVALAKVSLMQGKFANASSHYEKALDIVEYNRGKSSKELIPIYQGLGKVELAKGKLGNSEVAISMYETAHTICSGIYDTGALPVADTCRALADAYANVGGVGAETSAESYLNECLAIYLSHHGPNHKSTIEVKDELAKLMLRTERLDEGIKELKSTLAPKQEVYGEYSEEIADTHRLLANIYLAQGNMDSSLKCYKNCINIETMLHGSNHKRVKDVQSSIDMLLANPKLAAKQPKSKQEELKDRPRFSSVVNRSK